MRTARVTGRIADWSYQNLVALYIALIVYTNVALAIDYKFTSGYAPIFDLMVLALVVPLALKAPSTIIPFMRTAYFKWTAFLALVYLVNYLRMRYGGYLYSEIDLIEETNDLQRVVLWPAIGFIVYSIDPRHFHRGLYIALIAMPMFVMLDFLNPYLLGPPDEIASARAQGLYLNANVACEAIILLGILNMWRFKGLTGVVLIGLMGVGVLLTFSRSGIAGLILFGTYLYFRGRLPKTIIIVPILLLASFSTILVYAEDILLSLGYDASVANVLQRLAFFESVGSVQIDADSSGESRAYIAGEVFKEMLNEPVSGHVFAADSAFGYNPHNQPLHFWYKFGITGLIAWLSMVLMLFFRGYRTGLWLISPPAIAFVWFSFFSHNILDFRFWIVFFAFTLLHPTESWHGALGRTAQLSGLKRRGRRGRGRPRDPAPAELPADSTAPVAPGRLSRDEISRRRRRAKRF